jgi:hypothetical protein
MDRGEVLTPASDRWLEFYDRLAEKLGHPDDQRCAGDGYLSHQYARAVLEEMGGVDVEGTIEFCDDHGGGCDCEILMNVDACCAIGEAKKH